VWHRCNLLLESCIGWPMGLWLCRPYWPLGLGRPHCPGAPPLGLDPVIRIGKDPLIRYFHIPRHPCPYVLVLVLCTLINPILFSHTFLHLLLWWRKNDARMLNHREQDIEQIHIKKSIRINKMTCQARQYKWLKKTK